MTMTQEATWQMACSFSSRSYTWFHVTTLDFATSFHAK